VTLRPILKISEKKLKNFCQFSQHLAKAFPPLLRRLSFFGGGGETEKKGEAQKETKISKNGKVEKLKTMENKKNMGQ
jgi:hypothetical protein